MIPHAVRPCAAQRTVPAWAPALGAQSYAVLCTRYGSLKLCPVRAVNSIFDIYRAQGASTAHGMPSGGATQRTCDANEEPEPGAPSYSHHSCERQYRWRSRNSPRSLDGMSLAASAELGRRAPIAQHGCARSRTARKAPRKRSAARDRNARGPPRTRPAPCPRT